MGRRIRRRWWAVGAVLVLLAGAVSGYVWLTSDRAAPVVVEDVVSDYRRIATVATTTAPTSQEAPIVTAPPIEFPPAGVYVYGTVGKEGVDALGGSEHEYPGTTTVTISDVGDGCLLSRWDALEQRWDDARYCAGADGWRLDAKTVFHSFFHQSDTRAFTCDPGSVYLPADLTPGTTFTARCASAGDSESGASTEDIHAQVVGDESLQVADEQVATVHVRYEIIIGGESTGRTDIDRWYALDVPTLLVREMRTSATTSETMIGSVNYQEQYELLLQSLEPMR